MTTTQKYIYQYLSTRFLGCQYEPVGDDVVKVIGQDGDTLLFSCNNYYDILDVNTGQVIAKSSLSRHPDIIQAKNLENITWTEV